jgi:hypothetical protein
VKAFDTRTVWSTPSPLFSVEHVYVEAMRVNKWTI